MPEPRRSRLLALLASLAVAAATLVPATTAAAEEPPAPPVAEPVETSPPVDEPVETPAPVADPVGTTPAPTPDPAPTADPVTTPAPEPEVTEEPEPQPATTGTVSYGGTALSLAEDGVDAVDGVVLFSVNELGYLRVDVSDLSVQPDALSPVLLTLQVPAGLTLSDDADARFEQLAAAAAAKPLVAVETKPLKQTAPREIGALVNQTPNTAAVHKVFVVYVSPSNTKTKISFSGTGAVDNAEAMVAHADEYWGDQSAGTIGFDLQGVVPWYQSTYSCKTDAGSTSLWNQALAKAKSKGFIPGRNAHLVLLMPAGTTYCGGAIGLGTIGGSVNQGGLTWVMGYSQSSDIAKATLVHELGHNMSLGHATWLSCSSSQPYVGSGAVNYQTGGVSGCTVKNYGDVADVMGFGMPTGTGGALSSSQAIRAGIWPSGAWVNAPIGVNSEYTLKPVAGHTGLRSVVVQDTDGTVYFVEFRNFQNEDQWNDDRTDCSSGLQYCVLKQPNVRIQRFEPSGFSGYPGYDSYLIGRSSTAVGFTGAGTFWTGGAVNTGSKIEVVSITGETQAVVRITRSAPVTYETDDWIVVGRTIGYDNTLRVGDTLTGFIGDWWDAEPSAFTFEWQRNGTPIPSSNSQNYTLTPDDVGAMIRLKTTVAGVGVYYNVSRSTGEPIQIGPVSKGVYQADQPGTVAIDNSATPLVATTSSWPGGTTFAYQWFRGSTAIAGATQGTYTPVAADFNQLLKVRVTATVPGYNPVQRFSEAKNYSILRDTGSSALITGLAKPREPLSINPGTLNYYTFEGTAVPLLAIQWLRNGVVIPGETSDTYIVRDGDYGTRISARITASLGGWVSNVYTSPQTAKVVLGTFQSGDHPVVIQSGMTLTADPQTINPPANSYAYQWLRNGAAIKGATAKTFKLTSADYGKSVTVKVTYKRTNYESKTLASVDPGNYWLEATPATPQITSTEPLKVGTELTVGPRTYVDKRGAGSALADGAVTVTYQWLRDGVAIKGKTAATYTLGSADKGKRISVKVTVKHNDGQLLPSVATSAKTQAIGTAIIPDAATATVAVAATSVGATTTLKATVSGIDPSVKPVYAYQWYRNGVAISGATKQSYVLSQSDKDKAVNVRVIVSKKVVGSTTYTSVVLPTTTPVDYSVKPATVSPPRISGGSWQVGTMVGVYDLNFETVDGPVSPATLSYQWMRVVGSKVTAIPGATSATYFLQAADYGAKVTVRLTATSPGHLTLVHTVPALSYIVAKGVDSGLATAVVQEGPAAGVLTAAVNDLSPATPAPAYTYQWYRNGAAIKGATARTYKLVAADFDTSIHVRITMKRANFEPLPTPVMTSPAATHTIYKDGTPTSITGVPKVGETLLAVAPEFFEDAALTTPDTDVTLVYTWYRNGVAISGAKSETYTLVAADLGKQITVKTTATAPGRLAAASPVSAKTAKVTTGSFSVGTYHPEVTMTNTSTRTMTVNLDGSITAPTSGYTVSYQWYRHATSNAFSGKSAITGATAQSYKLTAADTGRLVTVVVKLAKTGYATHAFSPVEVNAITSSGAIEVLGTPQVGQTLEGDLPQYFLASGAEAVHGTAGTTISYQWMSGGMLLPAETGLTYVVRPEDAGQSIRFVVTVNSPYHASNVDGSELIAIPAGP